MIAYFGKTTEYKLYPLSVELELEHSLPTAHLGIYLYSSRPTIENARDGLNSPVLSIVAGALTATDDGKGKKFTIPLLQDPKPNEAQNAYITYYLAINIKNNASDTSTYPVTLIREIKYSRLKVQEGVLDIGAEDLKAVEPKIESFCECLGDLEAYIDSAISKIKILLSNDSFDWQDIASPEPLKQAVIHSAIALFFSGKEEGTAQDNLRKLHADEYKTYFKAIKLEIDNKNTSVENRKTSFSNTISFGN